MLRTTLICIACLLFTTVIVGQSKVGDNVLNIDPASILELESSSKGFLPSRLTTAQRDAQTEWDESHIIYNTDNNCLEIYDGTTWNCFVQGAIVDSTLYKFNGTLTSDRSIILDGNSITFDGSGDVVITDAGFVGIGDPTPDRKLDVEGGTVRLSDYGSGINTGSESFLLGVDSNGDVIEVSITSVGTDSQAIDTFSLEGNELRLSLENDSVSYLSVDLSKYEVDTSIYTDDGSLTGNRNVNLAGSDLTFDGTDDVVVKSTGRVGIGIADPERPLHVEEALRLSRGANTTSFIFDRYDGALGTTWKSYLMGVNASGLGNGEFFIADYNEAVAGGGFSRMLTLSDATEPIRFDQYDGTSFVTGNEVAILGVESDGDIVEVDASTIGSDNQIIDSLELTGSNLEIRLEGDVNGLQTLDLSPLDINIYEDNGTLTGDRTVSLDGNFIRFLGTDESANVQIQNDGDIRMFGPQPILQMIDTSGTELRFGSLPTSGYMGIFSDRTLTLRQNNENTIGLLSNDYLRFYDYGTGARTGAPDYLLGVRSNGDVVDVDLSAVGTDDQILDSLGLDGTTLNVGIEGDINGLQSVDLSPILGSSENIYNTSDTLTDARAVTLDGNNLTFDAAGTADVVIEADGDVGIGTTTPAADLHIAGDMRLDGIFEDKDGDAGTAGQILSSTATGTDWVDAPTNTDNQIVDQFDLSGNTLRISLEDDGALPVEVDLSPILGTSENIYNTSDSLEANRIVTMDGNTLTFDGTGTGDLVIHEDGDLSLGTTTAAGDVNFVSDEDQDAFYFTQENGTTGEKDVFTIEDKDSGGGGQDRSSVLKVHKSANISAGDDGFSLVELASTGGGDPGDNKYWISGRTTDEGAPIWGVDITDNDFWSEGGIILGVTGDPAGTYSGGNFIVEPDGDVGIGNIAPGDRLHVTGGGVIFDEYGVGTYNDTSANYIVVADEDGNIRELHTAKNTRWFYAPSVSIDASEEVDNATLDLYQEYLDQMSSPDIASTGAPASLPYYDKDELYYYVTFHDDSIITDINIDADGLMRYDIVDVPFDNYTIINIVFLIK